MLNYDITIKNYCGAYFNFEVLAANISGAIIAANNRITNKRANCEIVRVVRADKKAA